MGKIEKFHADRGSLVKVLYPQCPCCENALVPHVSDGPISYRIGHGPKLTIPRSQEAQLLRYLWSVRPLAVVKDHMYRALGNCALFDRARWRLGTKYGIRLAHEDVPKATSRGTYRLFALPSNIKVWEPSEVEQ